MSTTKTRTRRPRPAAAAPVLDLPTHILHVAVRHAVTMYRAGSDREHVFWMLVHAGHTADLIAAERKAA